ncbi:MAG TPA: GNAT family N-acetyltransferase [Candidatus Angelobacter sp.]|jgi:RimJ/RimL family protein N-acetyltransferase|nr:GNAT family N-acetyltransferase [Candidatus Angelobacter sp.]
MPGLIAQPVQVPRLETERLILRGHHLDDFAQSAAMWADENVTRYIRTKPFSEEESWTRFLRFAGHWSHMGFGYWAVEDKQSGEFVGEVGFADYKREMEPSLKGVPEIGWVLTPSVRGMGYACEAVRAATAWGDAHFGAARTACIVAPENVASIRVATKCGYRERQLAAYKGDTVLLFVREPKPQT